MRSFIQFLEELPNMEKTRNFDPLRNYRLEPFLKCYNHYVNINFKHRPLRFSIVGTNGKGSLAHYLSQFLIQIGSVGLFTSPHLINPLERIQINNNSIDEVELDKIITNLANEDLDYLKQFSYFEVFTLFSAIAFSNRKLDFEIYEAGLGGRLDATKALNSEILLITKIDLDHTSILGATKENILFEKLSIASAHTKKIIALDPIDNNLRKMINDFAINFKIPFEFYNETSKPNGSYLELSFNMAKFILEKELKNNDQLQIVKSINWKDLPPPRARMEELNKNPIVVYDTAHNPGACLNLLNDLEKIYPFRNWNCIVSILPDKDGEAIREVFEKHPIVDQFAFAAFAPFQSPINKHLTQIFSWDDWETKIYKNKENGIPTLVCGSFRVYPKLTKLFL
jgi:dihydrofolate synthase/folylpolyglutamate synthase